MYLSNCEQNTHHFVKIWFRQSSSGTSSVNQTVKLRPFALAEDGWLHQYTSPYTFSNDDMRRDDVSVHEGGNPGVERPAVREPRRDAGPLQPGEAQHVPGIG
jgi:hypothetical protein